MKDIIRFGIISGFKILYIGIPLALLFMGLSSLIHYIVQNEKLAALIAGAIVGFTIPDLPSYRVRVKYMILMAVCSGTVFMIIESALIKGLGSIGTIAMFVSFALIAGLVYAVFVIKLYDIEGSVRETLIDEVDIITFIMFIMAIVLPLFHFMWGIPFH